MNAPTHAPSCTLRAMLGGEGRVHVVTRKLAFDAQGRTSEDPEATLPSALDLLVAALATDLLAGLARDAARAGHPLHDAEASLSARLENPLVALGVIGESGHAGIAEVTGSFYVRCDAGERELHELWARTLARSPAHATLARAADVRLELKPML